MLSPLRLSTLTCFLGTAEGLDISYPRTDDQEHEQKEVAELIACISSHVPITGLALLDQLHGIQLHVVRSADDDICERPRVVGGDGLITSCTGLALGIMTADCPPVFLYTPERYSFCAALHVGWRGACGGIVEAAVTRALRQYGIASAQLRAFVGPCVGVCCYEVSESFVSHVPIEIRTVSLERRAGKMYFNLRAYVTHVLDLCNVSVERLPADYSACTMCDLRFISYRRTQGAVDRRMVNVAVLREL